MPKNSQAAFPCPSYGSPAWYSRVAASRRSSRSTCSKFSTMTQILRFLEIRIDAHDQLEIGDLLAEGLCEPQGNVLTFKNSGKIHTKNVKLAFRDNVCQEVNIDSRYIGVPRYRKCIVG